MDKQIERLIQTCDTSPAIIVPDNPELLGHIRAHPKLKGYIAPHSPKGLLMIKPESNPDNFYRRCKAYGFDIK